MITKKHIKHILTEIAVVIVSISLGMLLYSPLQQIIYPTTIPKNYQGYYLTTIQCNGEIYNHITHLSRNKITTSNSEYQIKNQGAYNASPIDHKINEAHLIFNVKNFRPKSKYGTTGKFIGHVSRHTRPYKYYNNIRKYYETPTLKVNKDGIMFTKSGGFVKAIKSRKVQIIANNIRVPKNVVDNIKINDSNNM